MILKTDLPDDDLHAESWVSVYPGADWHEREAWEMYGFVFDGHPSLRHLYLPSEFEGHPLRKDYPLLAREVKPWPGLVDVEPMPGEPADDDAATARRRVSRRDHHRLPPPGDLPEIAVDPAAFRHLADAQVNVELDTGDMVLNIGPQHPATHGTLRLVVRLDGERVVVGRPDHRLHAPRLREADRVPHLPADHHAHQPHRLALVVRERGAVHRTRPSS